MSGGTKVNSRDELEELARAGIGLEGVEAAGIDLTGIDLSEQDLSNATFRYADLSRANLRGAILRGANMRHVRLLEADLRFAVLDDADLSQADLHGAVLGETSTRGIKVEEIIGVSTEVFFPMDLLGNLLSKPGVELGDEDLTIPGDGIENYRVVQAFRIVEAEGGDEGDRKLLGKVWSVKQIKENGGEVAGSSVIVGDVSYRCEEGYIGVPMSGKVAAAGQPVEAGADDANASDMDLLKDFLLTKLE